MGNLIWRLFILAVVFQMTASARILCILPVKIKSHRILYDRLLNELASRGHSITFLTPFETKKTHANIKEIIIPDYRESMAGGKTSLLKWRNLPIWLTPILTPYSSYMTNSLILDVSKVKELIHGEPFDLIFGEPFLDEATVAGFSYRHKAPLVMLNTLMPNIWSNYVSGNPSPTSYIPDPLLAHPPSMTFCQRLRNFLFTTTEDISHKINIMAQNSLMHRHFGEDLPHIDSILRNTSLVLINNHFGISFPRPQLPNTVDVAGMHIYPPRTLSKDLQQYMDNAQDGVILFSLGTTVNSSDLAPETTRGILRAFSRLKQKVLWKFEAELEQISPNVKIAKWLPQSDILAHPNLKLFITHGGMLSTTEASYRGVPIVGIPLLLDQPNNVMLSEYAGIGVALQFDDLNEENLYEAVTRVLNNPRYDLEAKKRSQILHDVVLPPLETAVWWIEYVLRHKEGPNLRSTSQDLYWFQLHQIDVILTLFLASIAIFKISLCSFKIAVRYLRGNRVDNVTNMKKIN